MIFLDDEVIFDGHEKIIHVEIIQLFTFQILFKIVKKDLIFRQRTHKVNVAMA